MPLAAAVLLGIAAGALYTVSPLAAWTAALAAIVLALAGRGLPASERRALTVLLVIALSARLAAIGALVVVNTPMHDDESVGMLSGDEAYGLSRALRTRAVLTGAPVSQYDYFVSSDEYGRNSYITLLTGIQILFGPTPYSQRALNALLFTIAAILLFRVARSSFGALPAFFGLTVLLFLPSLFIWSISLLKEPLYLLGGTLVLTGAISAARGPGWRIRGGAVLVAALGLVLVNDLRPGALALEALGIGCGVAGLAFLSLPPRTRIAAGAAAALVALAVVSRPAVQGRLMSALETAAKTHAGHVFTVGHSYRLLDDGFYYSPAVANASSLRLTRSEAGRFVVRAAASFVAVPLPWQLTSTRELAYLPEQMVWYVLIVFAPVGLVAGWRRDPIAAALFGGYTLPTAAALALTNGNVGTLLRLRGIVIPYLLWLSAVGFCAWLQRQAAASPASLPSTRTVTS
jgi:hypothetical protein